MELVLVTRNPGSGQDEPSTADYRLDISLGPFTLLHDRSSLSDPPWPYLGDSLSAPGPVTDVSANEWPGAAKGSEASRYVPVDLSVKSHSLPGFSAFGSARTNEFATWTMGRETFLASARMRDEMEDDIRTFAERSDHTEGFMLTTPISDGFGGLASVFLEMLRDDFTKSTIFTTATMSDALLWKRPDTDRSVNQRLLNAALSMSHLEDLSSMVLPIQPPAAWEPEVPWAKFLRGDLPKHESYSQILTAHLQSANSELREIDGLTSIVNQLNWRGDNKIAHLQGAAPMLGPDHLETPAGLDLYKNSIKDFSVLSTRPEQKPSARSLDPSLSSSFAQYSVVRGFEDDEVQRLGPILESSTTLREPLSVWVCLPTPYPILPSSKPIFRSLTPTGRPVVLSLPTSADPLSPAGLFGLPPPLFATLPLTYFVQPTTIPILTTLCTSPSARYLLSHLSAGVKELQRTRNSCLYEYEEGEFGIGRDGLAECRERLETLADNHGAAAGEEPSEGEEETAEDEETD